MDRGGSLWATVQAVDLILNCFHELPELGDLGRGGIAHRLSCFLRHLTKLFDQCTVLVLQPIDHIRSADAEVDDDIALRVVLLQADRGKERVGGKEHVQRHEVGAVWCIAAKLKCQAG